MRYIIHKYKNKKQWKQMARSAKQQLPSIKYHNNKGSTELRDNISSLVDIFITPEAYGAHILGAVSYKCPGFSKCVRLSKYGFAAFSNSVGHQK